MSEPKEMSRHGWLRRNLWQHWPTDFWGILAILGMAVILGHRLLGSAVSAPGDISSTLSPWNAIAPKAVHNGILHDVILTVYPNRHFVNNELQRGQIPLWDPYIVMGQPALADGNMAVFYPTTLLLGNLSAGHALDAEMFIHILLIMLGTYLLVRVWGGGVLGAVAAATAFSGCSTLTIWQQYGILFNVAPWLPWLLLCFTLAQRRRRLLWLSAAGIVLGLAFLANFVQWTIYDLVLLGAFAAFLAVQALPTRSVGKILRPFADLLVTVLIGAGIGAIQLLPFFELTSFSPRTTLRGYDYIKSWSAPLHQLLTLFAPNFFGTPNVGGSLWGTSAMANGGFYAEHTIFWGILPGILALTAPFWRNSRLVWFLWAAMLLVASAVFGAATLHILGAVPAFDVFKPSRMSYLLCFLGAILCGLVLDRVFEKGRVWRSLGVLTALTVAVRIGLHVALLRSRSQLPMVTAPTQESLRWMTFIAAAAFEILALTTLRWRHARIVGQCAFVLLIGLDIAHYSLPYNAATLPEEALFPRPQVLSLLPASPVPLRVAAINQPNSAVLFTPNTLSVYGLADVGGYDSLLTREFLAYMSQVEKTEQGGNFIVVRRFDSPLLDLAGVQYFFSNVPLDEAGQQLELLGHAEQVYLYRNLQALPRTFIVPTVTQAQNDDEAIRMIGEPAFAPCRTAIVETPLSLPPPLAMKPGCVGNATITDYHATTVRIRANTPTAGVLVLSDAYYPGWQVTVDGVAQTVFRTDGEFRGVSLGPGNHDIEFFFRPVSLVRGGTITGVALAVALCMIGIGIRRRPQRVITADLASKRQE